MRCLVLATFASFVACSTVTVDPHGRSCGSEGECLTPFTCDADTNICVTAGDACDEEGRTTSCVPGVLGCAESCRYCQDGTWSECLDFLECEPDTLTCEDNFLIRCDFDGIVNQVTDCREPGCNAAAVPPRCNECAADTTFCSESRFVTCGPEGLIVSEEDCSANDGCAAAGTCDAETGCTLITPAPEGTPCDDGDGDVCDSSCRGGRCDSGLPASCNDGNECTADACDPASGCANTLTAGAPCAGTDGDACNSTCDAGGVCLEGVPLDCDDDNPCTADTCSAGQCSHPPGNAGTVCRAAVDVCDAAETCTGSSATCPIDGFASTSTACGDPVDHECDGPDRCDGDGNCIDPPEASGTPCGKQGECANGDTCDGDGHCIDNGGAPAGTPCGDFIMHHPICDLPDRCDGAGNCDANIPVGTRCSYEMSETECDLYDRCDASGQCDDNIPVGEPCGSQADTECTDPDTCSSLGICLENNASFQTPCGDRSNTDCTDPDYCVAGTCVPNNATDGIKCGHANWGNCSDGVCR